MAEPPGAGSEPSDRPGPLAGVRVVDLTRVLSGPFCTMLLGDLGAEVIKVETPAGDPVRAQGTIRDGLSWYFASFNRNKRSVTLDLYTPAGREALTRMLAVSDVVVDNFRPGTMERMGFGREALRRLNPRLVSGSVNGYGSTGPYVERPAFDFVVQAMSGFMSTNGAEGTPPMRSGIPITDLVAGLYAALGIVAALREREANGEGQHVEVAMLNAVLSLMAFLASEYFATGELPTRTGNDHPLVAPYGLYRVDDGEIAIAPSNETILRRLFAALDLEWVLDDPRFDANAKRFAARRELKALIEARMEGHGEDHWIARLNEAGVPCGKVQDFDEVFADPQVIAQGMRQEVAHPGGAVTMLGFPMRLGRTPCRVARPAPALGADTERVLAEIGVGGGGLGGQAGSSATDGRGCSRRRRWRSASDGRIVSVARR